MSKVKCFISYFRLASESKHLQPAWRCSGQKTWVVIEFFFLFYSHIRSIGKFCLFYLWSTHTHTHTFTQIYIYTHTFTFTTTALFQAVIISAFNCCKGLWLTCLLPVWYHLSSLVDVLVYISYYIIPSFRRPSHSLHGLALAVTLISSFVFN